MGYIRVRNLGKAYKRYRSKYGRLLEWLRLGVHHDLRWVLRDVSFDVEPGEAVGIVGVNGAGKSTLLKIIAGVVKPTTGSVEVGGRVSALLELGTGFHPDFTGRQNVYMSGQLKGLTKKELDAKIREIEDFAEIGDYFDQPLRTYSSGMQLRLAFSVATCIRPDILIVDEALSVGDIFFQQKCFDLIRSFINKGTTLLFVSHSIGAIYSLCKRAMLIDDGKIIIDGEPKSVIDLYNAKLVQKTSNESESLKLVEQVENVSAPCEKPSIYCSQDINTCGSYFSDGVKIESVKLLVDGKEVKSFVSESNVTIRVVVAFYKSYSDPHVGFQIRDSRGEVIFMTNTFCMGYKIGTVAPGNLLEVDFSFKASLSEGQYTITVGVANEGIIEGRFKQSLLRFQDILSFSVLKNLNAILWAGVYNFNPECKIRVLK